MTPPNPRTAGPRLTAFRKLVGELSDLETAQQVLHWDQEAYMPPGAGEGRAAQIAALARLSHDVHWSWGYFGNFPTYALGNLITSQLWERLEQDLPDLEAQLARAEFDGLLAWLRHNIHRHGNKLLTTELLQRLTGAGLAAEPYLRYPDHKFGQLYGLNRS